MRRKNFNQREERSNDEYEFRNIKKLPEIKSPTILTKEQVNIHKYMTPQMEVRKHIELKQSKELNNYQKYQKN